MARPYVHSLYPPLVANLCRICGVLPISWGCDEQGLPVIGPQLFCYSLCLTVFTISMPVASIVVTPRKGKFMKVVDLLVFGTQSLLVLIPSIIQCKRGLFKNICRYLKDADDALRHVQTSKYDFQFFVLPLISIIQISLMLLCHENIFEAIFSSTLITIHSSMCLEFHYTVKAIKTRLVLLSNRYEKWTLTNYDHSAAQLIPASSDDQSLSFLKKIHYLLGEIIFLVNSQYGLQLVSVFLGALSPIISNDVLEALNAYEAASQINIPKIFTNTPAIYYLIATCNISRFITVAWICSEMRNQVNNMKLTHIKKTKLTQKKRKELKTLLLQQKYHCTEISAAGLFVMEIEVAFNMFAGKILDVMLDVLGIRGK